MIRQLSSFKYLPLLIFILAFSLYVSNIGGTSIYILDEAKNAGCASEMFDRGDVVVPTFNDVLRTDKPPLHYFFMMLSYSVFGVNAFAARLFSSLFGALTVLITYLFTRRFADDLTALWTSLVLLASVHLSIQFHLAVPDPYLVFFFTSGLLSFYAAVKEKKLMYLLLMYVSIGFGTLAKGPVAIGLPGLIFLLFLIFSKRFNWKEIRLLKPFLGAAIVLAIAVPWYVLVHLKTNGAWTEGFFLKHNLGRFTSEMEGHGGIFLITIGFVLMGLFPFSVFIIQACKQAWKNRTNDFNLFNLIAGFTVVAFFAFSRTKLPNYTVPSYPFLAVLLGLYLQNINLKTLKLNASMWVLLILGIILVPGIFVGLKFDPALAHINYVAFYFFPLPLGIIASFYFWKKKQAETAMLLVTGSGMITALIFFMFAFPVIDRENPVAKSLDLVNGKEVRYFQKYNPSYSFYLQKIIPPVEESGFESFFNENPGGVIISTKKNLDKISLPENLTISFTSRDIFESPTTVLITKK